MMRYRWNVNRLVELEEQIGKFKISIGDSIRKRERSPNNEGKRYRFLLYSSREPGKVVLA